jgi:cytochrome c peroxidase
MKARWFAVLSALLLTHAAWAAAPAGEDMAARLKTLRSEILSAHGPAQPVIPSPENNPQSADKIKLGEALYFDPNLSSCATIACASCHIPEKGFADGQQISDGCNGAIGRRNSNTVYHTAFASHFFWDGRVQSLEQQALGPVVDPAEMANTWDRVLEYLKTGKHPVTKKEFAAAKAYYDRYFKLVFGGIITTTTVTKAIAAYERTIAAFDAPYDRWLLGDDRALTEAQKKGLLAFFKPGVCADCHTPPNFTDSDFHNLGVPNAGFEVPEKFAANGEICGGIPKNVDPGRAEVLFLRSSCSDLGKFRTPTLRYAESSGPYMHNGVFNSLEKAMAHMAKLALGNVTPMAGVLDPLVVQGTFRFAKDGNPDEIKAMVDFLKALSGKPFNSPAGGIAPPKL